MPLILLFASCIEEPIKATSLPQIHITCDEENLNTGDYQVNDLTWYDTLGNRIWGEKIRLRARGNRSATFEKHSYSLKLSNKLAMLGMPKSEKWKLNAEYIDKTFMRNKLSYDLFREFTLGNFAPEVKYCVVYVNDAYHGIYAMIQSVDAESLDLKKGNKGAALFKEPPVSHRPSEHADRFEKFQKYVGRSSRYKDYSIKARYKLEEECYFNQRYPDVKENNLQNVIYTLTDFIFNTSDSEFSDADTFNNYFDLENLIDWHLLILVTANGDGTYKNFYMSRKKEGHPFIFTPWDYDHSFGRDGDGEPSKVSIIPVKKNMALLHRLMETNAFNYRQKLYDKFCALRDKGILTDSHIINMIDANVEALKPEISDNEERWPLEDIDYFDGATFESEVERMKKWVPKHLKELETYLKEQSELEIPKLLEAFIVPELFPDNRETSAAALSLDPQVSDSIP